MYREIRQHIGWSSVGILGNEGQQTKEAYISLQISHANSSHLRLYHPIIMLLHTLYTHSVGISYRHSCCSWAALLVFCVAIGTVLAPYFIAYAINGDLWSTQLLNKWVLEQPRLAFTYRYMLVAEFEPDSGGAFNASEAEDMDVRPRNDQDVEGPAMLVSSSYAFFNELTEPFQRSIAIKVRLLGQRSE